MQVTGKQLIELAAHAKRVGTEHAWMDIACQWIEHAEEHIHLAFHPELGWAIDPEIHIPVYMENEKNKEYIRKLEQQLEEADDEVVRLQEKWDSAF